MMETRTIRRISTGLLATGLAGALVSIGYVAGGSIYTAARMSPEKPAAEERLEELENRMCSPRYEIKEHGIEIRRTGEPHYNLSDVDLLHGPFACLFEHPDDLPEKLQPIRGFLKLTYLILLLLMCQQYKGE